MKVWQVDCYRRPLRDEAGNPLWELLICDGGRRWQWGAMCPQSEVNGNWLVDRFLEAASGQDNLPDRLQVFRPQSLSLVEAAAEQLGIKVEPTRHTPDLKQWLRERALVYPTLPSYQPQPYEPLLLEQPPPLPLPENLWGDRWRFAHLSAGSLVDALVARTMPIQVCPKDWLPIQLGLAATALIPGVVIDGGRQAMRLARWLQQANPATLKAVVGEPHGLLLEAGLIDRWILATFTDPEVIAAAQTYTQRQQTSQGLHFLLVQPDDSGVTYSGFWLLRTEL